MGLYTQESIDRVKDAVDMVELVGARSDLRRSGTRWVGLCPFHDERTPSFSVNAENKLYYCFGCGESGDAIQFVEATEGLDFKETIELLADRYNIELKREQEDPEAETRRRRRERLLSLVERATTYYERVLWHSPEAAKARAYLEERGLGEEILRTFRVGYAPSAWDKLMMAAQREGFNHEELAAAGLGQKGQKGGFYDRFRARIMFPLADPRGKVLGFGARAMRDDQGPKYVNTSENELYHKGRQLFGIDHARGPAARAGRVVAVEGYTDVLALHQAGVTETVAIMGTALTQEQMAELGRAAGTVYLALDADRAGQEAMLRAQRVAAGRKMTLRVAAMPEDADPADLLQRGELDRFEGLIDGAVDLAAFRVETSLAKADLTSPSGRERALGEVAPVLKAMGETVGRDELVRRVASALDTEPSLVSRRVESASLTPEPQAAPGEKPAPQRIEAAPTPREIRERQLLQMCIAKPAEGKAWIGKLTDSHLSSPLAERAVVWLRDHLDDPMAGLPRADEELVSLVTQLVMSAERQPSSGEAMELNFLLLEQRALEDRIAEVRDSGDYQEAEKLSRERATLVQRIAGAEQVA